MYVLLTAFGTETEDFLIIMESESKWGLRDLLMFFILTNWVWIVGLDA